MLARARTQIGLTFALNRFTFTSVALGLAALAAVALFVAARLDASGANLDCLRLFATGSVGPGESDRFQTCQQLLSGYYDVKEHMAGPLVGAFMFLPVVAGLLAGIGLVAREIEERTASIAWSLAPSRLRWLAWRVVPAAAALAVILFLASIAANEVERGREPLLDARASFDFYGSRGWLVVAHGMLAFAMAIFVGSLMGRVLPGLIAAAVLSFAVIAGVGIVRDLWLPSQAVIDESPMAMSTQGSIWIAQLVKHPDGTLTPMDGAVTFAQTTGKDGEQSNRLEDGSLVVTKLVPGSRYGFVETVESAGLGFIALALAGGAWLVVRSRRPA